MAVAVCDPLLLQMVHCGSQRKILHVRLDV